MILRTIILFGAILVPAVAAASAPDPALVEKTENGAGTAMRIVLYGLDNEIPEKDDLTMARFLMKGTQECLDGIAQLRRTDPGLELNLNGQEPMSLDEVEAKFCKPAFALLQPVVGGAIAADEARYAGLSLGRKELIKFHNLGDYTIYGPGKRKLTTNAEKQAARVWFVWDHDRSYAVPAWWLARFQWNGDKYEKTMHQGQGGEPPASLFK